MTDRTEDPLLPGTPKEYRRTLLLQILAKCLDQLREGVQFLKTVERSLQRALISLDHCLLELTNDDGLDD